MSSLGTPVAVEATGDDGAAVPTTALIYGTGQLVLYKGPVETEQFVEVGVRAAALGVNDARVKAWRPWLVGWDCVAVAATVTL